MKKILTFGCILIVGLCSCRKQQQQEYAGVEGDTVNGTPLSQRQEGVSFFGNNVNRSQFQPVYFAFDSFEIQSSETEKLRQIASFLTDTGKDTAAGSLQRFSCARQAFGSSPIDPAGFLAWQNPCCRRCFSSRFPARPDATTGATFSWTGKSILSTPIATRA